MFLNTSANIFINKAEDRAFMYGILLEKLRKSEASMKAEKTLSLICSFLAICEMFFGNSKISVYFLCFISILTWFIYRNTNEVYLTLCNIRDLYVKEFVKNDKLNVRISLLVKELLKEDREDDD